MAGKYKFGSAYTMDGMPNRLDYNYEVYRKRVANAEPPIGKALTPVMFDHIKRGFEFCFEGNPEISYRINRQGGYDRYLNEQLNYDRTRIAGLTAPMNNFVKDRKELFAPSYDKNDWWSQEYDMIRTFGDEPMWKREMQSEIDSWLSSVKI